MQKAPAWKQFQKDLMDAVPYIVPYIIPYKDVISIALEVEKEIKGSTSQTGRSNEEILASFLSGEDSIPLDHEVIKRSRGYIAVDNSEEAGIMEDEQEGQQAVGEASCRLGEQDAQVEGENITDAANHPNGA